MDAFPFKGQDYENIRKRFDSNNLFTDDIFKADINALAYSLEFKVAMDRYKIKWMRPKEICKNPQFVVDGYDRLDICQGGVGDCWFIAGIVAVAQVPKLLDKVVPENQNMDKDYSGIFHFCFYQYGEWYDVVIDDLLPCSSGQLLFCKNKKQKNEFWPALLEKAYAKLYGSYEALNGGVLSESLADLTGGIGQTIQLRDIEINQKNDIWITLNQAYLKNSLSALAIEAKSFEIEKKRTDGLVEGHAYTITKLTAIVYKDVEQKLIRIKNPWGDSFEWNGAWSDKSYEWKNVSDKVKKELGLVIDSDGEFWMSYEDLFKNFDVLYLCHLSADCFLDEILKKNKLEELTWTSLAEDAWKCKVIKSSWVAGKNSGGADQITDKFWSNPKYMFEVKSHNPNLTTTQSLIISLSQKKNNLAENLKQAAYICQYNMLFSVYKIREPSRINSIFSLKALKTSVSYISSSEYTSSREIILKIKVLPGYYLVLPSLEICDVNVDFVLKIVTEEPIEIKVIDDDFYKANKKNYIPGEKEIVASPVCSETSIACSEISFDNRRISKSSIISIAQSCMSIGKENRVLFIESNYKIRESNMSGSLSKSECSLSDFENKSMRSEYKPKNVITDISTEEQISSTDIQRPDLNRSTINNENEQENDLKVHFSKGTSKKKLKLCNII